MKTCPLLAAVLLSAAASASHAGVVAEYGFTGNTLASADTDKSTAASNLEFAATFTGSDSKTPGILSSSGNPAPSLRINGDQTRDTGGGNNTNMAEDAAVKNGDYLTFTITPERGVKLKFASISIDTAGYGEGDTRHVYFLRSDAGGDNFTTTLGTTGIIPKPEKEGTFTTSKFDLSGVSALKRAKGPVTFRLYVADNRGVYQAGSQLDNLVVNANVVR